MQIKKLHLYTTKLQAQHHFYQAILGLPTSTLQADTFTVTIGQSQLQFHASDLARPYHFAINIPANKIKEATVWLAERVAIQPYKAQHIVNFEAWNAQAVYFYDEDQNIVELIARKNTQLMMERSFGVEQWLSISEIGAPTSDVEDLCAALTGEGLPCYSGDLKNFAAIGDEEGLFIIINKDQRKWLPNDDLAFASPFRIELKEQEKTLSWVFKEGAFTH